MYFCPFKIGKSRNSIPRTAKGSPDSNQNPGSNNNSTSLTGGNSNPSIITTNTNHNNHHARLHDANHININNNANLNSPNQKNLLSNQHHGYSNNNNNCDTLNNRISNQFNPSDGDIKQAINSPYRYATAVYHAKEIDELSVIPGELLLLEYTDSAIDTGDWSHVLRVGTNQRGFVPSHILTTDVRRNPMHKKKMTQSSDDPCRQHHHLCPCPINQHQHHHHGPYNQVPHHHHPHKTPIISTQPSPTNPDNVMCLHPIPRFGIPHSVGGSSGEKHSFQNFNSPAYYNLISPDPNLEHDFIPFHREVFGLYVVIYNFVAREENDISVKPGDYVTVLNKDDPDWYWVRRECDHAEGFVPARFMKDYEQVKSLYIKMECVYANKQSLD